MGEVIWSVKRGTGREWGRLSGQLRGGQVESGGRLSGQLRGGQVESGGRLSGQLRGTGRVGEVIWSVKRGTGRECGEVGDR